MQGNPYVRTFSYIKLSDSVHLIQADKVETLVCKGFEAWHRG